MGSGRRRVEARRTRKEFGNDWGKQHGWQLMGGLRGRSSGKGSGKESDTFIDNHDVVDMNRPSTATRHAH